ncbi:MAG: hypothetical protein J5641_02715, partial [Bacteroidales bacterium]|nr:hypothetical protein [Bacteroidales bacterium]
DWRITPSCPPKVPPRCLNGCICRACRSSIHSSHLFCADLLRGSYYSCTVCYRTTIAEPSHNYRTTDDGARALQRVSKIFGFSLIYDWFFDNLEEVEFQ